MNHNAKKIHLVLGLSDTEGLPMSPDVWDRILKKVSSSSLLVWPLWKSSSGRAPRDDKISDVDLWTLDLKPFTLFFLTWEKIHKPGNKCLVYVYNWNMEHYLRAYIYIEKYRKVKYSASSILRTCSWSGALEETFLCGARIGRETNTWSLLVSLEHSLKQGFAWIFTTVAKRHQQ